MATKARNKKVRSKLSEFKLRHYYNKKTGLYKFLGKGLLNLILLMAAILLIIFVVDYFFNIKEVLEQVIYKMQTWLVIVVFFISESILGMIPPDIFIVWAKQFTHPFLVIAFLATISYIGGINAYFIGKLLRKIPKIDNYIFEKFSSSLRLINKFGGIVIISAALFPLPFAMTATAAGMVNYSFVNFILYGLTRYIRFFIYAFSIFSAINSVI